MSRGLHWDPLGHSGSSTITGRKSDAKLIAALGTSLDPRVGGARAAQRALVTCLALLQAACSTGDLGEKGSVQADDASSEPEKVPEAGAAATRDGEGPIKLTPGEFLVIGKVGRRGVASCTRDAAYDPDWTNISWRVGDVELTPPAGVDPASVAASRVVVARGVAPAAGAAAKDPTEPAAVEASSGRNPGNCMPMQMRSDWTSTPDGIVVARSGLQPVPAIQATSLTEWKRIALTSAADGLSATLKLSDDLGYAALGLEITAHYEGCYGKPGSTSKQVVVDLLANGSAEASFALHVDSSGQPLGAANSDLSADGHTYRLDTIQVSGGEAPVYFAVDVDVASLGLPVECTERGSKAKAAPGN